MIGVILYTQVTSALDRSIPLPEGRKDDTEIIIADESQATTNPTTSIKDDKTIDQTPESSEPAITITDYLSSLFCTGCSKHCPLTNPQCSRGDIQVKQATQEYQSIYGA